MKTIAYATSLLASAVLSSFAEPVINSFSAVPPAPTAAEGEAPRVLKWQDGRKAVFLLAFDDSCVSHLQNVVPLLQKYRGIGTFYLIGSSWQFTSKRKEWEALAGDRCVAFGNHTFTHGDVEDAAKFDTELQKASDLIHELTPDMKWPRLLSFGQPGVKVWNVSKEEYKEALAKHHLADRPPFLGASINVKTIPEAEALVDKALANGDMGHLDFHGVGGDWLSASNEFLEGLLKKLAACRDDVWQPAAVDYHKYLVERDAATVKTVAQSAKEVRVELSSTADPAFYDLPLTVEAAVPAAWTRCHVEQKGLDPVDADVVQGRVRFYALPGAIVLTPAK